MSRIISLFLCLSAFSAATCATQPCLTQQGPATHPGGLPMYGGCCYEKDASNALRSCFDRSCPARTKHIFQLRSLSYAGPERLQGLLRIRRLLSPLLLDQRLRRRRTEPPKERFPLRIR